MAPAGSRKRVKLTPPGAGEQSGPSANDGAAGLSPHRERSGSRSVSWYPGVWPTTSRSSKAAPVTEVARESISADHNHTPSNTPSASTRKSASPKSNRNLPYQLTKKAGASSRSLPATTTTTRINIASDGSASTPELKSDPNCATTETPDKEQPTDKTENAQSDVQHEVNPTAETSNVNVSPEGGEQTSASTAPAQPSGWFSWFYGPSSTDNTTQERSVTKDPPAKDSPQPAPEEPVPKAEEREDKTSSGQDPAGQATTPEVSEVSGNSQKRSWLQMWYGTSSTKGLDKAPSEAPSQAPSQAGSQAPSQAPSVAPTEPPNATEESTTPAENAPASINHDLDKSGVSDASGTSNRNSKSSGWSLWFRDTSKDTKNAGTDTPNPQAVEASMNQDSSIQTAKVDTELEPEQKVAVAKKGGVKLKSLKSSSSSALPDKVAPPVEPAPATPVPSAPETGASKQLQKALTNQVLPLFKDTFAWQERPSLLQTIGRFLHYSKEPDNSHAYVIRDPPRIKRALAIGVHGYFPAPLIRSVLGQPTGTSIRFSNMAADSIRKWTEDHGYTCDIEKIALEGEGRIAERVDLLWKLLLNWMEEIRNADFILVASHSQGVPVAIILVAKLIAFGCLNAARVGICAMAGVNLGPFSDYRSRWISGSAGELFEFALPYSQVSKDYESALRSCLNFGVRISYIGSIDDQLVSLESSLFSPVTHPYVYRAVFVDGRVHAPSFLSHLVGFALKLRNLGISDHGLIRELSSPLAGSLYSGEGHSRLYDDEAVYRLAIEFALETSTVANATLHIKRSHPASGAANPYILPFAMRGLLEEEYVRRELYDETMELLRQFDDWKPTTKVLKDVKFRLEGIRSKL